MCINMNVTDEKQVFVCRRTVVIFQRVHERVEFRVRNVPIALVAEFHQTAFAVSSTLRMTVREREREKESGESFLVYS